MNKEQIMDDVQLKQTVKTISDDVMANNPIGHDLHIIGIRRRGAAIAKYIADNITEARSVQPLIGELDVTLYRDDLATLEDLPVFFSTNIPFDVNDKRVLLVDDVIFTGRTARAALDAIFLLGRPKSVELAVLVDRGNRELPIQPNYTGIKLDTNTTQYVRVKTPRFDGELSVTLWESKAAEQREAIK